MVCVVFACMVWVYGMSVYVFMGIIFVNQFVNVCFAASRSGLLELGKALCGKLFFSSNAAQLCSLTFDTNNPVVISISPKCHVYTHTHTHIYIYIYIYLYMYAQSHIHVRTITHTHTYNYTNTRTYTRSPSLSLASCHADCTYDLCLRNKLTGFSLSLFLSPSLPSLIDLDLTSIPYSLLLTSPSFLLLSMCG